MNPRAAPQATSSWVNPCWQQIGSVLVKMRCPSCLGHDLEETLSRQKCQGQIYINLLDSKIQKPYHGNLVFFDERARGNFILKIFSWLSFKFFHEFLERMDRSGPRGNCSKPPTSTASCRQWQGIGKTANKNVNLTQHINVNQQGS